MKQFKNYLKVSIGLVLLTVIATIMVTDGVEGQGNRPAAPVKVVNTKPIPTTVEGGNITGTFSGEVDVNNFPAVQQVSGAVSVNNFPLNTETSPMFVHDVDNPALTAIQAQTGFSNAFPTFDVFLVPAGSRLVIEHVSARATTLFGDARLITRMGGYPVSHQLSVLTDPYNGTGVISQQTKLYGDPGTIVGFWVDIDPGHTGTFTISGHLVPIQ